MMTIREIKWIGVRNRSVSDIVIMIQMFGVYNNTNNNDKFYMFAYIKLSKIYVLTYCLDWVNV